ncbi:MULTISPECIES: DNA mismatch repair endonuclease MutL [Enterocloster]|uniref:DNA mismatch repair protein MutL n=1 Tax=Enterocloster lavalensis TaxID=460384 RepID=A0A1I0B6Z3_9FIRM|nr:MULTISPECIES: DNA mismatch repair endonuclease MutL [Enterocloster]MDR3757226.1 DNA mismatch repair endonuclease MutL [Enterocloster sp.]PST31212.1 DNA mismatch repair endonuclease MutL [Enterocloster lavalensis]SET02279.1 DNA mismatch repair protein MutL [Enterocloster lavalensis]
MANITVLDQNTINKIAAGEVIERPASVVKELLENAIDAQATAVTIEIKEGGTTLIRVTDNGCGIPKDQISLAFLRHATSKIKSVEDLFTVSSLGFRGEALASIAAVAQVELITKTGDSLTGFRYQIEGGAERGLEEVGAPDGTTFIARNLFYNTPARKKFLKRPVTEGAYVADLVEKIALSHPEISIRFIQNNQNKLYTSGNHNLRDLVYTVYGREVTANLLPIDVQAQDIKVSGFIGKPLIARGNRNYENYFINGRYIKSSIISKAIEEAYKPYMMQHKYPFTLLHFSIEPEFLDVNVHPTKMELRFRDGELMFKTVLNAVGEALSHRELIPLVSLEEKRAREEAQQKERLTPRPEPFEVRRRQTLENGGTTDRKSESISPLSSNNSGFDAHTPPQAVQNTPIDYRLIPHKSQNQLRETSGSWNGSAAAPGKAARPASHAADLERELFGGAQEPENQPADCKLPADLAQAVLSGSGTDFAAMPGTDFADKPGTGFPATPGGVTADGHETKAEDHPAASHSAGPQPERAPRAASQDEETSGTADASPEQLDLFDTKFLDPKSRLRHKLIGQLFDTYWLVEYDGMLVIIDQHAAHEKILYENTMKSLKTRQYDTQMVNPPIILTLSMNEELLLNKYMDYFTNLGFEIENFGGREYAVRGVPANLFSIAKRELLIEMIDGLSDEAAVRNPDIIYEKVASMSCKAAVKGHMSMSAMEANELIDQLLHLDNPYNCPHGRPVIISMTKYELEKKFKRIV